MSNTSYSIIDVPKARILEIDKQYQKIDSIIRELKIGVENKSVESNIPSIFYGLMHLYSHYFIQEQITLAKYKYKDLCLLKSFHKKFLDDVLAYREKIAQSPHSFCSEMLEFMNSWVESYFLINQKAIDFLESKGVK